MRVGVRRLGLSVLAAVGALGWWVSVWWFREASRAERERNDLRRLLARIAKSYDGSFDRGGHVYLDAETWKAVRREQAF